MIVAGLVALLAGLFLLFVEVKDFVQVVGITFAVIGLAILLDTGRGLLNR